MIKGLVIGEPTLPLAPSRFLFSVINQCSPATEAFMTWLHSRIAQGNSVSPNANREPGQEKQKGKFLRGFQYEPSLRTSVFTNHLGILLKTEI